jgi:hypothetical protein
VVLIILAVAELFSAVAELFSAVAELFLAVAELFLADAILILADAQTVSEGVLLKIGCSKLHFFDANCYDYTTNPSDFPEKTYMSKQLINKYRKKIHDIIQ